MDRNSTDGLQQLAVRKFIFGSYRIFSNIENSIEKCGADKWIYILRGSKHLREQLATFLADIIQIESSDLECQADESLQNEFEISTYLAATWHLIEAFYLDCSTNINIEIIVWLKVLKSNWNPVVFISNLYFFPCIIFYLLKI